MEHLFAPVVPRPIPQHQGDETMTQLLTPKTVCDNLGITDKTLRRYVAEGRLPAYRMGGRLLRFKAEDVDALLTRVPTA